MKPLKVLLLSVIMTLVWIRSFGQSIDSLETYPVAKYKLWRLIDSYRKLPYCDSTVTYQEGLINEQLRLIEALQNQLETRSTQIGNLEHLLTLKDAYNRVNEEMFLIERKEARKWKTVSIGGGVALFVSLILR